MKVVKTVSIKTISPLTVTVTPSPLKGYVNRAISVKIGCSPLIGERYSIDISFGDGNTQHLGVYDIDFPLSVNKAYTTAGTYTISILIIDIDTGGSGSGSASVQIKSLLSATFSASPTSGNIPLSVSFSGSISGGYTPYSWTLDFGDGSTPASGTTSSVSVSHTYNKVGTFTATLTVIDALGTSAVTGVILATGTLQERLKVWWDSLTGMQKTLVVLGIVGGIAGGYYVTKR